MALSESLLFYLLIGAGVAVAVWTADAHRATGPRSFRAATAVLFWPVYLPILLTPGRLEVQAAPPAKGPSDELATCIAGVERELDAALASLDGWAEQALGRERPRIGELRAAWTAQASRIHEMDMVLQGVIAGPETEAASELLPGSSTATDRVHESQRCRRQNLLRLKQVRDQAYEDLRATLARVRELISLIHLAKFTGAPASRADELVLQIAASVEGLSEVTQWPHGSGEVFAENHAVAASATRGTSSRSVRGISASGARGLRSTG
jgi:hypothetical protein